MIKVLWLCGNPGLYHADKKESGGWIGSLQQKLIKDDIEIVNVFEYPRNSKVEHDGKVTYYPLYFGVKSRILSRLWYRHHDKIYLKRLKEIILAEKPDIIHCWGSELGYGLIAKETDIPMVMHIQGLLNPYLDAYMPVGYSHWAILKAMRFNLLKFYREHWYTYRIFRKNAQREKEIMSAQRYVLGRTVWDKSCSSILSPNAEYLYCSETLRPEIMNHAKWVYRSDNRLVVMSVMSNAIYKGIDVILHTARYLKVLYGDNFEWNVYGVSDISLHERITGIKSNDVNVYVHGRASGYDIADYLASSDVYCHQAYIENSPNSVCEAQYIGVPIVAAMVGGMDTILKNGSGVMVPANDAWRTAFEIVRFKTDKTLAEEFHLKEIAEAETRHKEVELQLMNIYKKIKQDDGDKTKNKGFN